MLSLLPNGKQQFIDIAGRPLVGGRVYFYAPNTETKKDTWQDPDGTTPNTNPVILDARGQAVIWGTGTYRQVVKDVFGLTIYDGLVEDPISAATGEITANLAAVSGSSLIGFEQAEAGAVERTVEEKLREWRSLQDFGGDPTGSAYSSDALQKAFNAGVGVLITPGSWKFEPNGVEYTGSIGVVGYGSKSKIVCDGALFTVTNGDSSFVDNLYMENATAPWIIKRDPNNWSQVPSVVQSNDSGYQPTINDADIWGDLTTAQQNQNIGPSLNFQGNATGIAVRRIYGRFVSMTLKDAINSTVEDCRFRASKGLVGGITFWNIDAQRGNNNRALNNHIFYPSFSGICWAGNDEPKASGNHTRYAGESGLKTYQGTMANSSGITVDARCYLGQFDSNRSLYSYYDNFDFTSQTSPDGTIDTRHQITNNQAFGARQTGFYGDGKNNVFANNTSRSNGLDGMSIFFNQSLISNNHCYTNNVSLTASHHDLALNTGSDNLLIGNLIWASPGAPGYAIYAPGKNMAVANKSPNGLFFWGNAGAVTSTLFGNSDSSTVAQLETSSQMIQQTVAGTPGLQLFSNGTGVDNIDFDFFPRNDTLTHAIARIRGVLTNGTNGSEGGWLELFASQGGVKQLGLSLQANDSIPSRVWNEIAVPEVQPYYGWSPNWGNVTMWLDQTNNALKFQVKYQNGTTVKSGSIALS